MAIEIEQEKKKVNVMGVLMAVVVIGALFAGAYFFLFRSPELVDVVVSQDLKDLKTISDISFDPERVLKLEKFKALRRYESGVAVPAAGKGNPFLP